MRDVIPERERWLALGLLAAVIAVAYLLLVHPWWTRPMLQLGERIDSLQQRELRARMAMGDASQLDGYAAQLQEQLAGVPGFLPELTPELATAALVQRLETVVSEASPGNRSCAIINRSPLPGGNGRATGRVAVQARLRCGHPELAAVLHSLEGASPRLFVDNLNILSQRQLSRRRNTETPGGLDVSFDLYGYLQPTGGADAD